MFIALMGYRNYLQHGQIKATSTVNTRVAALHAWCAWLQAQGYLADNAASRLKSVGCQAPLAPKGLIDRQVKALLCEAQCTRYPARDYALIQIMLQTGMRVGECAALNIDDIAFGERSGSVRIRSGKGNKARIVPLTGPAWQALAEYIALFLGVEPTIKAAAWPHRSSGMINPLWRSQNHRRFSTSVIRLMIDQLVHDCASRKLVPATTSAHSLCHTFGMNYLKDNPGDLIGLAMLLGHSSLDTTRIYG